MTSTTQAAPAAASIAIRASSAVNKAVLIGSATVTVAAVSFGIYKYCKHGIRLVPVQRLRVYGAPKACNTHEATPTSTGCTQPVHDGVATPGVAYSCAVGAVEASGCVQPSHHHNHTCVQEEGTCHDDMVSQMCGSTLNVYVTTPTVTRHCDKPPKASALDAAGFVGQTPNTDDHDMLTRMMRADGITSANSSVASKVSTGSARSMSSTSSRCSHIIVLMDSEAPTHQNTTELTTSDHGDHHHPHAAADAVYGMEGVVRGHGRTSVDVIDIYGDHASSGLGGESHAPTVLVDTLMKLQAVIPPGRAARVMAIDCAEYDAGDLTAGRHAFEYDTDVTPETTLQHYQGDHVQLTDAAPDTVLIADVMTLSADCGVASTSSCAERGSDVARLQSQLGYGGECSAQRDSGKAAACAALAAAQPQLCWYGRIYFNPLYSQYKLELRRMMEKAPDGAPQADVSRSYSFVEDHVQSVPGLSQYVNAYLSALSSDPVLPPPPSAAALGSTIVKQLTDQVMERDAHPRDNSAPDMEAYHPSYDPTHRPRAVQHVDRPAGEVHSTPRVATPALPDVSTHSPASTSVMVEVGHSPHSLSSYDMVTASGPGSDVTPTYSGHVAAGDADMAAFGSTLDNGFEQTCGSQTLSDLGDHEPHTDASSQVKCTGALMTGQAAVLGSVVSVVSTKQVNVCKGPPTPDTVPPTGAGHSVRSSPCSNGDGKKAAAVIDPEIEHATDPATYINGRTDNTCEIGISGCPQNRCTSTSDAVQSRSQVEITTALVQDDMDVAAGNDRTQIFTNPVRSSGNFMSDADSMRSTPSMESLAVTHVPSSQASSPQATSSSPASLSPMIQALPMAHSMPATLRRGSDLISLPGSESFVKDGTCKHHDSHNKPPLVRFLSRRDLGFNQSFVLVNSDFMLDVMLTSVSHLESMSVELDRSGNAKSSDLGRCPQIKIYTDETLWIIDIDTVSVGTLATYKTKAGVSFVDVVVGTAVEEIHWNSESDRDELTRLLC